MSAADSYIILSATHRRQLTADRGAQIMPNR